MTTEKELADVELNTCAFLTATYFDNRDGMVALLNDLDFADLAGVAARVSRALLSFLEHEHKIGVGPPVPERISHAALRATDHGGTGT